MKLPAYSEPTEDVPDYARSWVNDCSSFEYVGNLHIHSLHSDGTGTVREISQAAKRVGLDFIILNDHDCLTDALHLDEETFYEGLLVLLGLEIGERYHHYLAYNLREMIKGQSLGPQDVIDCVDAQGGFGFLAHPFEKGMPFSEKSVAYTWNDLSVKGYTGICIWNFSSRWKERIKTAFHALFFLLFRSQTLKGPSRKTLSFWDELCSREGWLLWGRRMPMGRCLDGVCSASRPFHMTIF